jgi:hypothetical protein
MAFSAGGIVLASQLNGLITPGWTAFTPSWTGSGSNPVINNGSIVGRYRRVSGSDLVTVEVRITMGSTTTFGSGTYWVSVPVTPSATATLNATGAAYTLDSGTLDKAAVVVFEDNTKVKFVSATGGVFTPTVPQTFANGDQIRYQISYEPA